MIIWYQVFIFTTNNLQAIIWFQISNYNNVLVNNCSFKQPLGNVEYSFITFTPKSTLTWIDKTYFGPIYQSNRTVQSFTKDYYY